MDHFFLDSFHSQLFFFFFFFSPRFDAAGPAFTGIVGAIDRHEFAVIGKSVNLAARLMCLEISDGDDESNEIIVDSR